MPTPVRSNRRSTGWRSATALKVYVVANSFMNVPRSDLIERVIVPAGPDVADDWIAERAGESDIVITADIPLAARCVRNGATVIGPTGKPFDDDSIGMALATRNLLTDLRAAGAATRGPPPLSRQDLSRFLSALDLAVTRLKRKLTGRNRPELRSFPRKRESRAKLAECWLRTGSPLSRGRTETIPRLRTPRHAPSTSRPGRS